MIQGDTRYLFGNRSTPLTQALGTIIEQMCILVRYQFSWTTDFNMHRGKIL
jgi:hypothetical protein